MKMTRKSSDYIQLTLEHGIDIPGRTIYLTSSSDAAGEEAGIDWQMADRVIRGLRLMGTGDQPITLVINSHGGEDDHARAIIAAIKSCPNTVNGVVYGRAESAGAWIFLNCDWRVMHSNSNLMLHMGASNKDKHSKRVDRMFVDDVLVQMQTKFPNYSRKRLEEQLHEDWYIYSDEVISLGLCDEVI
jgi:ATP-dependent Clp protease protease subunit